MTAAEFKKKWSRYTGKESSAYQEHFNDLCRLLKYPPPAEADSSGEDFFCFQKFVVKDRELFGIERPANGDSHERGFADVWKKGCFAWEYKGKKKNLDEAYKQLLRYRESLLNPPLLVVCDFERYIIKTNFNGTVQEVHKFTNAEIDRPENFRILRALFSDPEFLKPQRTTAQVTETLAKQIAVVARSLQERESVEFEDAKTRREVYVAQKKNLRIARFLNRITFCFFAEDTALLPKNILSDIAKASAEDPRFFAERLEELFAVMATGGTFGVHKIRHFNGVLFEDASVFELTEKEIKQLAQASEADWQFIEPSIFGTLFERGLDPDQRAQLGAHYTSRADIETLVEPVLMAPLRREWAEIKIAGDDVRTLKSRGKKSETPHVVSYKERLESFQKKLSSITVLDPACGSGNFLYVSLQLLLGLEKEVITFATQLGLKLKPQVSVQQLKAIEINPYAFELAQVSVQIGYLQWRRDNGFDNDRSPVLQTLDGFENKDALLNQTFRKKPKNLKEAQAEEHGADETVKVYTERAWPECDVIVGNPPFLGGSRLWKELGREYQKELWKIFEDRVPGFADLCCYWFEKSRHQIEDGKCKRAGLLATQGIRGGANREVLERIKKTGDIFFAVSDQNWILNGASVHVSMVGFDNGAEKTKQVDGHPVALINPNLTANADVTKAAILKANSGVCFIGTKKAGQFEMLFAEAKGVLSQPQNPNVEYNSSVLFPWLNGESIVRRTPEKWIIYFAQMSESEAAQYEMPFERVCKLVLPDRKENNEERARRLWWQHRRPAAEMRQAVRALERYIATPRVSKHRIFAWSPAMVLPDDGIYVFRRDDDYFFGILHSRLQEIWARSQGTQVRERESGFRYTPTTCFETFPFPFADDLAERPVNVEAELNAAKHYAHIVLREEPPPRTPEEHREAIAAAAEELNELRERWLNPPEWTVERILEFPGTIGGPWDRYIDRSTFNSQLSTGLVRYPRLEPRDADCAAKLKKRTLTNLYNERPAWLDLAHKKLDAAVATAYGFSRDLTDEQILERLLALNLERAANEEKTANKKQKRTSREKREDEMV